MLDAHPELREEYSELRAVCEQLDTAREETDADVADVLSQPPSAADFAAAERAEEVGTFPR